MLLWKPNQALTHNSHMAKFMQYVNKEYGQDFQDYQQLHQWSVKEPENFWQSIANFCGALFSTPATQIKESAAKMQDTKWFVGATLNFAENLLKRKDDHTAIIFTSENNHDERISYKELYHQVASVAAHLRKLGVGVNDRVAAVLPNRPETIIAMLATTSIGAIWSSCSSDFGLQGLLDRFEQIEPTVLFAVDGHFYKGKTHRHIDTISQLQNALPSLKQTIVVPYAEKKPDISKLDNACLFTDCLQEKEVALNFEQLPFDHPVYILYSSGTTGKPKCMVHSAGGALLQLLKELMLHTDLHPNDRIFFNTTCGWMMWNWLISSLAVGATVILFDGAPFHPKADLFFDLIDIFQINIFGVGAKYLESCAKFHLEPNKTHSLSSLRTILTTGSPLLPSSFDYVYEEIKGDVQLSSISGGSDIVSCFVLGNPILPVYRGEIQCMGLGMDMHIFNEEGQDIIEEKGEFVCTSPFPSMPIYFWNDENGAKYEKAYFSKYDNIWAHGDYAEITKHRGLIIYGRSDATLNPRGVRIGSAEIYQQVEKFDEIIDCLAVGQQLQGSERIILFVVLRDGIPLSDKLIKSLKTTIRKNTSPHHVPERILAAPELPRTISGKVVELAVKKIIHGEEVKNREALANPDSLDFFKSAKTLLED